MASPPLEDETELKKRVRGGSSTALAVLANRWRPQLIAHIAPRINADLRGRVDADDVLQEALVYALRAVRRLDLTGRDIYCWICQVCDNRLVDLARRHRAGCRNVSAEESAIPFLDDLIVSITSPSGAAMRGERAAKLAAAVASLSKDVREMLRLRYADGLVASEIGRRMGKSADAVRTALSRALKQLESMLGESASP